MAPTTSVFDLTPGTGNQMLIRLERKSRDLLSLQDTLNSYVCEPKTPTLFERLQQLRTRIEQTRDRNRELMNALKARAQSREEYRERVRKQLTEFAELEVALLEYIGMAKLHC